jgi:hypothetical protein
MFNVWNEDSEGVFCVTSTGILGQLICSNLSYLTERLLTHITFKKSAWSATPIFSLPLTVHLQFTSSYTKVEMADAAGRIGTLSVRCACGESFASAETYGRHKWVCGVHQKKDDAIHTAPSSSRRFAIVPARASISASSPKPVACWCGRTFKDNNAVRQHRRYCAVHKQQTNAHSDSSNPPKDLELNSGAGLVSAAEKCPIPLAESTAKRIQCPCGQIFGSGKALNKHLRYLKTY